MRWTPQQQQAIYTREGNLLVSAAAGSGKTAVLVERVIHGLIHVGIDIDQLLVVTFTEAAAAEMRQRIAFALGERLQATPNDTRLARQLALLPRAHISTLHSFCLWVLRRYYYLTDLDPALRVMDDGEDRLLKQEVLAEIIEEHCQEDEPGSSFYTLIDNYSDGAGEGLQKLVLNLHDFMQSQVFPAHWLQLCIRAYQVDADTVLESLPWWHVLRQYAQELCATAQSAWQTAIALARGPQGPENYAVAIASDMALIDDLLQALSSNSWDSVWQVCTTVSFKAARRTGKQEADADITERVKSLREQGKEAINKLVKDIFTRPAEQMLAAIKQVGQPLQALIALVEEFGNEYSQVKLTRGLVNFADLERYCLQILLDPTSTPENLIPSSAALELHEQFAEIFCDEYQDINPVQDGILSILAGESEQAPPIVPLFMVGDIKQSIYRFRLAEPSIFTRRCQLAQTSDHCRLVNLSANFRCRTKVVTGVNELFSRVMSATVGDVNYGPDAELVYAAAYPPLPADFTEPDITVAVLEGDPQLLLTAQGAAYEENDADEAEVDLDATEREAVYIARNIKQLLSTGSQPMQVWDKVEKAYRPLRYRDIAILLRATRVNAGKYVEVFQREGLPIYAEVGSGYFQAPEVSLILSLLTLIDNPRQDLPLAGVLRSPLVGLRGADLHSIRQADKSSDFYQAVLARAQDTDELAKRLQRFITQLDGWRTQARQGGLADLLWGIYDDTSFYEYVGGLPGGEQRQANLRALYDRTCQFDQFARQGLLRFLQFITDLRAAGEDLGPAPALGEGEDVVRLMSIHKSKGLEFPVVYVAGLGTRFNQQDQRGSLLFDRQLGLGLQQVDATAKTRMHTLASLAVRQSIRQHALSEEMRVLYVAMTRAREKLVLVGSGKDLEQAPHKWQMLGDTIQTTGVMPSALAGNAGCYLDWVMPVLYSFADLVPSPWQVQLLPAAAVVQLLASSAAPVEEVVADQIDAAPATPATAQHAVWEQLERQLAWEYAHKEATVLPAKISVTELKRRDQAQSEDAQHPGRPYVATTWRSKKADKQALTGAQIGAATHLVLQRLPLMQPISAQTIADCVQQLIHQESLSAQEGMHVDQASILRFFASPLGQRLQVAAASGRVYREVPFVLAIPDSGEEVLLQGVADSLFAEDDGWVLLDFKTDHFWGNPNNWPEQALQRYGGQLRWYRRALAQVLDVQIKESYLYLLTAGQAVPLPAV